LRNVKKSVFTPKNEGLSTPSKNKIKFTCNNKKDDETFEYEEEKEQELTNEEKIIYGNREPKDYKKLKILGKYSNK
jgi:hypothetical protein